MGFRFENPSKKKDVDVDWRHPCHIRATRRVIRRCEYGVQS